MALWGVRAIYIIALSADESTNAHETMTPSLPFISAARDPELTAADSDSGHESLGHGHGTAIMAHRCSSDDTHSIWFFLCKSGTCAMLLRVLDYVANFLASFRA